MGEDSRHSTAARQSWRLTPFCFCSSSPSSFLLCSLPFFSFFRPRSLCDFALFLLFLFGCACLLCHTTHGRATTAANTSTASTATNPAVCSAEPVRVCASCWLQEFCLLHPSLCLSLCESMCHPLTLNLSPVWSRQAAECATNAFLKEKVGLLRKSDLVCLLKLSKHGPNPLSSLSPSFLSLLSPPSPSHTLLLSLRYQEPSLNKRKRVPAIAATPSR